MADDTVLSDECNEGMHSECDGVFYIVDHNGMEHKEKCDCACHKATMDGE